jgi:hypothetical protein
MYRDLLTRARPDVAPDTADLLLEQSEDRRQLQRPPRSLR